MKIASNMRDHLRLNLRPCLEVRLSENALWAQQILQKPQGVFFLPIQELEATEYAAKHACADTQKSMEIRPSSSALSPYQRGAMTLSVNGSRHMADGTVKMRSRNPQKRRNFRVAAEGQRPDTAPLPNTPSVAPGRLQDLMRLQHELDTSIEEHAHDDGAEGAHEALLHCVMNTHDGFMRCVQKLAHQSRSAQG